jgi:hypothetical protein
MDHRSPFGLKPAAFFERLSFIAQPQCFVVLLRCGRFPGGAPIFISVALRRYRKHCFLLYRQFCRKNNVLPDFFAPALRLCRYFYCVGNLIDDTPNS